jgi:hypothetical protein
MKKPTSFAARLFAMARHACSVGPERGCLSRSKVEVRNIGKGSRALSVSRLAAAGTAALRALRRLNVRRQGPLFVLFLLAGCASRESEPSNRVSGTQQPKPSQAATTNATAVTAKQPLRPRESDILQKAESTPPAPFDGEGWEAMFDGKSLAGWRETEFAGHGEVERRSNLVILHMGDPFTGIAWTNAFPQMDYEIALDAMRVSGSDFFCGLTFPVSNSFCSLIVGGWGSSLLGLSSIDGMDASENETTKYVNFEQGQWYRVRVRVTNDRIEGWLDKDKLVDVVIGGRRISLRAGEIEMSKPLGIASWQTTSAIREVRMRRVSGPADPPKKQR